MPKISSASAIINKMIGTNILLREKIDEQRINTHVARMIYQARTEAGLTQAELAKKLNTKQPVIARLEDADYEGHSLTMLQRIADVLGKKIKLEWAHERK
ncbi:MAG TPA: helix-turn-helix transcriptional regulator [Planctomycetota bacterium]|nr:helix-turn-helix transcriptional regulator [Planctomycetota bacterium]